VRLHFLQGLARCNPAHILTLSFQPNEQRFLFREFSFGFDHLAFQPPQLVNNGVSIHLEHGSPRACANQSKNARPGSERAFFEPKILGETWAATVLCQQGYNRELAGRPT
jgi:hypothetical protein